VSDAPSSPPSPGRMAGWVVAILIAFVVGLIVAGIVSFIVSDYFPGADEQSTLLYVVAPGLIAGVICFAVCLWRYRSGDTIRRLAGTIGRLFNEPPDAPW
jgi:uncharacterized membrane protein YdcZ (DUF606 family)